MFPHSLWGAWQSAGRSLRRLHPFRRVHINDCMLVFIPAVLNGLYRCMARGHVSRWVQSGHGQACCRMFFSVSCLSPLTIASRKACVFVCVAGGVLNTLGSPRKLPLWNTDFAGCGSENEGECTGTTTHSLRFTTNHMFCTNLTCMLIVAISVSHVSELIDLCNLDDIVSNFSSPTVSVIS